MSFHTTNTIQQNTHHAQSLLQCLVIALQGSVLAGFTYSHMDLFRLTNNDNLGERLIFDVLVEIIASYKRYLGNGLISSKRARTKNT